MAEEFDHDQRELAQLWKRARKDGCMPPWQQAKVFGLKEAWEEMHGDKTYGQLKWIAERVYVQGHPKRHPNHEAVRQLLKKMATDEDWFPVLKSWWIRLFGTLLHSNNILFRSRMSPRCSKMS